MTGRVIDIAVVLSVSTLLVVTCVAIHYRVLVAVSAMRRRPHLKARRWLNLVVLAALLAHVVELSVFAVGYWLLEHERFGQIVDAQGERSTDVWYFSFVAYTSLGFGDLTPRGPLRFITALETLTGLLLIAWTASFVFVEMQRTWNRSPTDAQEN